MIKILYFIFSLYLDLAKSSMGQLQFFIHVPMNDHHFGYKQKFLKKTLHLTTLEDYVPKLYVKMHSKDSKYHALS